MAKKEEDKNKDKTATGKTTASKKAANPKSGDKAKPASEKKSTGKKKTTTTGKKATPARASGKVKGPKGMGEEKAATEKVAAPKKTTRKSSTTKASEKKETKPAAKKTAARKTSAKKSTKAADKKTAEDTTTSKTIKRGTGKASPAKKKAAKSIAEQVHSEEENEKTAADKLIPKKKGKTSKPASKKVKKEEEISETPAAASLISDFDIHLFKEGKHYHLYKKLGSHLMNHNGTDGVYFAVWAPNARQVNVIGDFNDWDKDVNTMHLRQDDSGIWEIFIPEAKKGSIYKYFIRSNNGYEAEKGDPFAFMWETPPETASVVWDLVESWNDGEWLEKRKETADQPKAVSVYELHMGSWRRVPEEGSRSLTYVELAQQLPAYIKEMGFTHVEFMPVMEHPFYGSWGYQITGYFAPTSRHGTPQDFMYLIDALHQAGIGVILDWVPSHFPSDLHGLHYFDGTFLYEHADPKKGFHPDWKSYIFNYGRNEVRSFLISNSVFWLDQYHVDALRVDAVASMLYLDYSRKDDEWIPNEFGGRENLEAISFLKEFNEVVYSEFPDIFTVAEESTAWPMVSKPTYLGGLGFGMKWMMGWMHDTLEYFQKDPIHRKHHQNDITFSTTYAFTENFMLPLSHDEVVYGKQAMINKMPGDDWNKFANLRSLYSYMYAHPGTKLLFMGAEFGQTSEWDHDSSLDWHLTNYDHHRQVQETLKKLNELYKTEPALHDLSFSHEGFEWVDIHDAENSVISFLRKGHNPDDTILVVCNLTPVARENYRIGVPAAGNWREIFNSDDERFGGSNVRNLLPLESQTVAIHGKDQSIALNLPPMGVIYLKRDS